MLPRGSSIGRRVDAAHRDRNEQGLAIQCTASVLITHSLPATANNYSANLNPNTTATANFDNISPPPKDLIPEILSVVPVPVLWDLVQPASRSSLASQFSAGTTPAWYRSLPSDVRSYMSVVKSQIAAGALTATAPATTTPEQTAAPASTSSGEAVQATAGLGASLVGALGVLGLAIAL